MTGRWGSWAGGALAGLAVLLVASSAMGASWYAPVGWTNGTVLCEFGSSEPAVGVSALSVAQSGLTAWMAGLAEVRPNGSVAASAELSGRTWTVANLSTDDAYDLAFSILAPISAGAGGVIGSVNLSVQFVLPAYNGSPDGAVDEVTVLVAESGWAWQSAGDHLEMTVGASPSVPATEHLAASAAAGWTLSSFANSSGVERERLGFDSTARVNSTGGASTVIPANASLDLTSPESATVAVDFGTGAGAYSSLEFTAHVGVVLPATVAGIPLPELVAAIGAGALVSLLVAVSARRLRRRPSRLIYAEDEP